MTRIVIALFAALFTIAMFAAGCSTKPAGNTAVTNAAAPAPASSAPAPPDPAGSSTSPTETLRALSEASKKHDPALIKHYLSEGTLRLLEQSAREQNKPVDDILREEDGPPFLELPEMRNEQISGDTATVEIKGAEMKEFDALPFVREDGMWKVAIDKYVENMESALDDDEGSSPQSNKKTKK
jgi:hypothetical protein